MTLNSDPQPLEVVEFAAATETLRIGHRGLTTAALLASDIAVLAIVLGIALAANAATEVRVLLLSGTALIILRSVAGLVPGFGLHHEARLRKAVMSWTAAALLGLAAAMLFSAPHAFDTGWFLLGFLAVGFAQTAANRVVRAMLSRYGQWGEPVRLSGGAASVAALRDWLVAHPEMGMNPVGDTASGVRKLLWADTAPPSPETLSRLGKTFRQIVIVHDLPKLRLSGVHPSMRDGSLGMTLNFPRRGRGAALLKRTLDIAFCLPMALVSLPLIGLAALSIRLVDPGPAFFVQTREGLRGKPFGTLKLRTMYLQADRMLEDLLENDPAAREEWYTHFKLRNDPRILPIVGTLLRRTSLDELPQVFNILRGDMSLVGPRPFPTYHLEAMPPAFRARRASAMPGLTGLWQITDRSEADLRAQQLLDDYYLSDQSLWTDISIVLRTFVTMLGRSGAY